MKFKSIQSAIVVLAGACLFVAVGLVTLYSINSAERSQRFVQDSSQNLIEPKRSGWAFGQAPKTRASPSW